MNKMIESSLVALLCVVALIGCKNGQEQQAVTEQPAATEPAATETETERVGDQQRPTTAMPGRHRMGAQLEAMCPMYAQGTEMTMEDVEGGFAMTFVNPQNVDDVRQRAKAMVEHHEQMQSTRPAEGARRRGSMMPAFTATVEDVEGGARVIMKPKDSATLESLRTHMRQQREKMADQPCPMEMMMPGMMGVEMGMRMETSPPRE